MYATLCHAPACLCKKTPCMIPNWPPYALGTLYQTLLPPPLSTYRAGDTSIITLITSPLLPIRPLLRRGMTTKPWPLQTRLLDVCLASWLAICSSHAYHSLCLSTLEAEPQNLVPLLMITTQSNHTYLPTSQVFWPLPYPSHDDPASHHNTALPNPTNTMIASCTYIAKANGKCITTAKQAHRLRDACVADYLSKWTDAARVSLLKSDVLAGFYFISPTKKLLTMLLPIMEKATDGNNTIIRTLSNSASISKLTKIKASTIRNIFALLPSMTSVGSLHKGPDFLHTDVLALEEYFLVDFETIYSFKFVKLPNIFPLPSSLWDHSHQRKPLWQQHWRCLMQHFRDI